MRSVAGHMPRAKYSLWLNCNPTENVPIITPPLAELMSDTEKIGERANVLPDHPPPQKQKTEGALRPAALCMEVLTKSRRVSTEQM